MPTLIRHHRYRSLAALVALAGLALHCGAETAWPVSYPRDYREGLTAADWVGPDGVVYPRFDQAGVVGGIPSADWPVLGMVRWYPGHRDITDELQATVDEVGRTVQERGLRGGVVLIPHGTFVLSRPITVVYDGVAIRGMGKGDGSGAGGVTRLMFQFDRPAEGSPWIIVHRFDGQLTSDSVAMVFGDARYRWNNDDDPVQPNRTILEFGLRVVEPGGQVVAERRQRRDEVTQQAYFRQWDLRDFARAIEGRKTIHLQPWVIYEDGEQVVGAIQQFGYIDWDRPALRDHRRPNRRLGGHASLRGAFMFIGDQWSHRSNLQNLARPALRGDTVIHFEHDLSLEEHGGIQPGDLLSIRAEVTPALREATRGGHPRQQVVTVLGVEGTQVTIDQPLRMPFPVSEGDQQQVSHAIPQFPITDVGLEDLVIQFPDRRDWFSAFTTTHARNFWMRGVRVVDVGQYGGFMSGVKNGELRDCDFVGAHWPKSGGTAYIGFAGCHDSLMENVSAVGQRHGPDFHGGAGNVVRNSTFHSGSDLQWHNGYGVEHLVENVVVGRMGAFGGSYGRALHTPDTGNQMHSPPGPRNVIWNSDLYGGSGGMHLGGYQQSWIFAYNRIHVQRGSAFSMRDRQVDHLIIGNTLIMEDLFAPVLRQGGQGRGASTGAGMRADPELALHNHGIELIANTIYGSDNRLVAGWEESGNAHAPLRRSSGNRILPPDHGAPRPDPATLPMPSLFEAQRQHPQGMPPQDSPLYHPDPDRREPDSLRVLGELVAQVNFIPSREARHNPEGWHIETGEEFGERADGLQYGWNGRVASRRSHRAGSDPGRILYDTSNEFGDDPERAWSIAVPPGRYEVEIALGDGRYPNWGTYDAYRMETTWYAVHDILVNGQLLRDRDGLFDNFDVHHAVVTVGEEGRLTLRPAPRSNNLRIQFIRVHEAAE